MRPQYCVVRTTLALFLAALLLSLWGCSKPPLSGIFTVSPNPNEIDMVRLVEAPPGHLSGSITATQLSLTGTLTTTTYALSGSLDQSNVSLQINSGAAAIAGLFGVDTNLVGTVTEQGLVLSHDADSWDYKKTSDSAYHRMLAHIQHVALQRTAHWDALANVHAATSFDSELDGKLQNYLIWGQARIAHVADVHTWYAERIRSYTNCQNHIAPLAAEHVPSWQWQSCVLNVEDDQYARDQEFQSIQNLQSDNRTRVQDIMQTLQTAKSKYSQALKQLQDSCTDQTGASQCMQSVQALRHFAPYGPVKSDLIDQFHALQPKVEAAIDDDLKTATVGKQQLKRLSDQISSIYKHASSS